MKKILFCFFIDCSSSTKSILNYIRIALQQIMEKMKVDEAMVNVDPYITIILFNHDYKVLVKACPLAEVSLDSLEWEAEGATNIGKALLYGLQEGATTYKLWIMQGYDAMHPYYCLLTDGIPDAGVGATDEEKKIVEEDFNRAVDRIKEGETRKYKETVVPEFTFVAAGIRGGRYKADIELLKQLTSKKEHIIEIDGSNAGDGSEKAYQEIATTFKEFVDKTTKYAVTDEYGQCENEFF